MRVHTAALPAANVTTWFGCPVTAIARTIVDVARTAGVRAALVAADGALH